MNNIPEKDTIVTFQKLLLNIREIIKEANAMCISPDDDHSALSRIEEASGAVDELKRLAEIFNYEISWKADCDTDRWLSPNIAGCPVIASDDKLERRYDLVLKAINMIAAAKKKSNKALVGVLRQSDSLFHHADDASRVAVIESIINCAYSTHTENNVNTKIIAKLLSNWLIE